MTRFVVKAADEMRAGERYVAAFCGTFGPEVNRRARMWAAEANRGDMGAVRFCGTWPPDNDYDVDVVVVDTKPADLHPTFEATREEPACVDCGGPMSEGEAACFTVCTPCWTKAYAKYNPPSVHTNDPVNAPPHYRLASGVQCLDVIEELGMGFHRGSAFAYLWRAGRKGGPAEEIEDLKKARFYIDRELASLEAVTKAAKP